MILGFSTQLNGKETFFVEKILKGIQSYYLGNDILINMDLYWHNTIDDNVLKAYLKPKIHTIREDKNNRWQLANNIDFFINCRKPNMQRFAPVLPVLSVQRIQIRHDKVKTGIRSLDTSVIIDNKIIVSDEDILKLAQNDGFDTIEDFFSYFDKDFTGKLIHWTDLRY